MITQGPELSSGEHSAQVVIIGTGAGGSVLAWQLAERGVDVLLLEAGGYHPTEDLVPLEESRNYPMLYQERMTRATADAAIAVLQGRSYGGGTTINWTTCFRTPDRILEHWRAHFGIELGALDPHWEAVEQALNISDWPLGAINPNNAVLHRGLEALGWESKTLRRNVRGCVNSGYCGLGCAFGAKMSAPNSTLRRAVQLGARVYTDCRAWTLERQGGGWRVNAQVLDRATGRPSGVELQIQAPNVVVAGGAINSPALLLRSEINPGGQVGKRTMLHPVVGLAGRYPERIDGWAGAPQSIGSHHFIERGEQVGFFLETPPMQPMLIASAMTAFGGQVRDLMAQLPHLSTTLALSVDGLHDTVPGGEVRLLPNGQPKLHYPIGPALVESFRASTLAMARVHLAAGAEQVVSLHMQPVELRSESDLPKLEAAPYGALEHAIFSAHQMGGCAMGADPETSVVDTDHRVRGQDGLWVVDGSVLPTALGVNPSQTIYGLAHRAAGILAQAT